MMGNDDWNLIYCYTRAQAIEDGVLIDVSEQAKAIGFKVNTCITSHLYGDYLVQPDGVQDDQLGPEAKLIDLLLKTLIAASSQRGQDRVFFDVLFQTGAETWQPVQIVAVIGPGDHGEPVLTIMLPEDE